MTFWTMFASVLLFIGLWLLGSKSKWGFVFSIVGEAIWTVEGIRREMYDLAAICFVFGAMAAINWYRWHYEEKNGKR